MPVYEFECRKCGQHFDQHIALPGRNSSPPSSVMCQKNDCTGVADRVFTAPNLAVERDRAPKPDLKTGEAGRVLRAEM